MSFSSDTKAELCRRKLDRQCCALAESYGILLYCNKFTPGEIRIISSSRELAERLPRLFSRAFGIEFDRVPTGGSGKFSMLINDGEKLKTIFNSFGSEPDEVLSHHINYSLLEEDCCRTAFLRGAFLSGGSVTDPEKQYHLEFMTSHKNVCAETEPLLRELGFVPGCAMRKNGYMLYFKKADMIEELLAMLGAGVASMGVATAKVERSMHNSVNRILNCDTANIDKTLSAAQAQIDAIHAYAKQYGLDSLPEVLRDTAILRITNPEASLSDLGKLSYPPVSKSTLAYRLRKIAELMEEDE